MRDRIWSELRARWRALVAATDAERELDDEIAFHLEQASRALEARGVPRDEAARRARAAFGGVESAKEAVRDVRGVRGLLDFWADVRDAARSLRAHRAFTIGVAGTLALRLGANAAMFGIVDRLMFRAPAGLQAPDRVHRLYVEATDDGERRRDRSLAYPRFQDFARDARAVERVGAFQVRRAALGHGADTHLGLVAVVSASYLEFFDAPPILGRWFTAAEDLPPAGDAVVVLGHAYWRTQFGGRPEVLGQRLQVDRLTATVVGVAPPWFAGVSDRGTPDVFVPMSAFAHALRGPGYERSYNWSWLEVLVQVRPGVTVAAAERDLTSALVQSWRLEAAVQRRQRSVEQERPVVSLSPVPNGRGPDARLDARVSLWIAGVALAVLLIACANVANLLLSRAVGRQRELAMRLALGIGRARLARQLVIEGLLLGILAALGGIVLAWFAGGPLRAVGLPDGEDAAVLTDVRTVGYAALLAIVTGLLTAIVPAWMAGRLDLAEALKSGGRGTTHRRSRLQSTLVVVQAALSVVLLVGAALFVRSLRHAEAHRLGYDVTPLVYAEVNLRGERLDEAAVAALAERLLAAARAMPGVTAVTTAASVPFWSNEARGLYVAGTDDVAALGRFTLQVGTADYFEVTGTRILRGRAFDATDRSGTAPVIVVSEGMARALWPGQDPLRQCVRVGEPTSPCREVIGVAEEAALDDFAAARRYSYYLPVDQYPDGRSLQFMVRTSGAVTAVVGALQRGLPPLLPGAAYITARPLAAVVAPQFQGWRFGATMFVAFGGLALVVALLGLHSLIAYESARRAQEFGVRVALGATPARLLALVVGRGAGLAMAGVLVGLGLSLAAAGRFETLLFRQSARDPFVLGGVAVALALLALVASAAPAVRAARVDPTETLRAD